MKALRYLTVLLSIAIIMMLQACGDGGEITDTSGNLTLSAPAFTDTLDGNSIVSFTATFAPPAGKTAQGVVITIGFTDGSGNVVSTSKATLNSGSNSVSFTFLATNLTTIGIFASIDGMTADRLVFVPAGTTIPGGTGTALSVTPTTAAFTFADTVSSTKTITISGGTAPFTVASSVPADIGAIMTTATTATVTLINAAAAPAPGISANATVTVTDSATPATTRTITVTYLK